MAQDQHSSTPPSTDPPGVPDACQPECEAGPVREAGGTTGANNLSPMQANRTGGATSGVDPAGQTPVKADQVPPDA